MNTPPHEPQGTAPDLAIMTALAVLPPQSLVSEQDLAQLFQRDITSVKRAITRGELPPPVSLFNQHVWTVEVVLQHINARLEAAAKAATQTARRHEALRPVPGPRDREG